MAIVRPSIYINDLFLKLIMLSSKFFLTGPYANIKPRGKEAIQLQAGKHISTQGKINC